MNITREDVYFTQNTSITSKSQRPENNTLTWNDYDKRIVELFFKILRSDGKPDFIVAVGEDSMVMGNALARLFDKPIGYLMTTSLGTLAEHVSIVDRTENELQKKALQGKGLLVSVASKVRLIEAKEKILKTNSSVTEIRTETLFKASMKEKITLPDEIFNRLDLSELKKKDLVEITEETLYQIACTIYEELLENPSKKLLVNDFYVKSYQPSLTCDLEPELTDVLNVTWDDYGRMIINLALKTIQSDLKSDYIVGIGRGGLSIAKGYAELLRKPLGVTIASSYKENGECKRSRLVIAEHISIGEEVLLKGAGMLIDDLVDSGVTLEETKEGILKNNQNITSLTTAVLFQKLSTKVIPDFYVKTVKEGRWIILPDEIFERLNLIKLERRDVRKMKDEKISELTNALFYNLPQSPKEQISNSILSKLLLKYC